MPEPVHAPRPALTRARNAGTGARNRPALTRARNAGTGARTRPALTRARNAGTGARTGGRLAALRDAAFPELTAAPGLLHKGLASSLIQIKVFVFGQLYTCAL